MNGYYIELIQKGMVKVNEDVATYFLSEKDIQASIEKVKANRVKFSSEIMYQRRLAFFEEALRVARAEQNPDHKAKE